MDVKLENIIEKLRKEGVETAQKEADSLLGKAREEAAAIVGNAKKEAQKMVEDARKKAVSFDENSRLAVQQAVRDGELLLKGRINLLFDRVFKNLAAESLSPDFIKSLILKLSEKWSKDTEAELVISKADQTKLEKILKSGIRKDLASGITLKVSPAIAHGFRIAIKGKDVYYDFSDESIAEILRLTLNTRLKEMLDTRND